MAKKKCFGCGRKINSKYSFCPYCGFRFREDKEDYGILGRDDYSDGDSGFGLGFRGLGIGGFGKLFNSLFREVDKQFRDLDKESDKTNKDKKSFSSGISINISSSGDGQPRIKVRNLGDTPIKIKEIKEKKPRSRMTRERAKKLTSLPREEASTSVRRLSNKIIYEIDLPGVKSMEDVIINKLENSIEIKAIGKDRAFFKLLPVNLPIINYKLEKDKLLLELRPER